mmetsp:Transcript_70361/g.205785  ORF Transcript_70361/g.205785 Transcript_70361/m.205785 type:complete len:155 (+) Transcript_70361:46-510(+)
MPCRSAAPRPSQRPARQRPVLAALSLAAALLLLPADQSLSFGCVSRRSATAGLLLSPVSAALLARPASAREAKKPKFDPRTCMRKDTGESGMWTLEEAETRAECLDLARNIAEKCAAVYGGRDQGAYPWCVECQQQLSQGKPCEPRKMNFAKYR